MQEWMMVLKDQSMWMKRRMGSETQKKKRKINLILKI
jgi:hypothetical protein